MSKHILNLGESGGATLTWNEELPTWGIIELLHGYYIPAKIHDNVTVETYWSDDQHMIAFHTLRQAEYFLLDAMKEAEGDKTLEGFAYLPTEKLQRLKAAYLKAQQYADQTEDTETP